MSRLHEIKVGKLSPTKNTFKESRNDKETLWERLKAFLKKDVKNV